MPGKLKAPMFQAATPVLSWRYRHTPRTLNSETHIDLKAGVVWARLGHLLLDSYLPLSLRPWSPDFQVMLLIEW